MVYICEKVLSVLMFNIPQSVGFVKVPVDVVGVYDSYPLDKVSRGTLKSVAKRYARRVRGCQTCEVSYKFDRDDIVIDDQQISVQNKEELPLERSRTVDVAKKQPKGKDIAEQFCVNVLHGEYEVRYNSSGSWYAQICKVSDGDGNELTYQIFRPKYFREVRTRYDRNYSEERLTITYRKNGGTPKTVKWLGSFYLGRTYYYKKGNNTCMALASASDVDKSWKEDFRQVFKDGVIPRGIEICSDGSGNIEITAYPYRWAYGLYTVFRAEDCVDRVCVDVGKIAKTKITIK